MILRFWKSYLKMWNKLCFLKFRKNIFFLWLDSRNGVPMQSVGTHAFSESTNGIHTFHSRVMQLTSLKTVPCGPRIRLCQLKYKMSTCSLHPIKSGNESNYTYLSFVRLCVYYLNKAVISYSVTFWNTCMSNFNVLRCYFMRML